MKQIVLRRGDYNSQAMVCRTMHQNAWLDGTVDHKERLATYAPARIGLFVTKKHNKSPNQKLTDICYKQLGGKTYVHKILPLFV